MTTTPDPSSAELRAAATATGEAARAAYNELALARQILHHALIHYARTDPPAALPTGVAEALATADAALRAWNSATAAAESMEWRAENTEEEGR